MRLYPCSYWAFRIGSSTFVPGGKGCPGVKVSNTVSVEVTATWCATKYCTRDVNSGDLGSTVASAFIPGFWLAHRSGCLSFTKSVATKNPCSRLSIPASAASRYVTEQRCPVILSPRLWASRTAARSSGRVMFMYALNDVAPASAQKATKRWASAESFNAYIWVNGEGPLTYGAVASIHGPNAVPALIAAARLRSA